VLIVVVLRGVVFVVLLWLVVVVLGGMVVAGIVVKRKVALLQDFGFMAAALGLVSNSTPHPHPLRVQDGRGDRTVDSAQVLRGVRTAPT
jgi:hypothetical protein